MSDLSPLKNAKLTVLHCQGAKVTDLSPLKEMPLRELRCDFKFERDAEILRSIKTLETINEKPARAVLERSRSQEAVSQYHQNAAFSGGCHRLLDRVVLGHAQIHDRW